MRRLAVFLSLLCLLSLTNHKRPNLYIHILNLTEEEVRLITRFRRGEGLLCIGHNHVPISVFVSPKEYEAITTSPTDRRARNNA